MTDLKNALEMTGCRDAEDLIDMANVGRSLMNAIDTYTAPVSLIEGWSPADDPAEIVGDLYNLFEESVNCHKADLDRLRTANDEREWRDMSSAPQDGSIIEVVGRYPEATAGFPRYVGYQNGRWVEHSRFEPQEIIPLVWRPRTEFPQF